MPLTRPIVFREGAMQIWIDRGGTFTDCVLCDEAGTPVAVRKLPSEGLPGASDAALEGIRHLLGLAAAAPGEPLDLRDSGLTEIRLGTTVATNALLTRSGARTLLVTTCGFEDLLWIGDQARPELFALNIRKPEPLAERVVGLEARCAADGEVLAEPEWGVLREALRTARAEGMEALAVSLLHADRNPAHEREVARLGSELGFACVVAGHQVSPLPHFLARTETAVAHAYLSPVLRRYVEQFRKGLGLDTFKAPSDKHRAAESNAPRPEAVRVRFMQSAGGLVDGDAFHGNEAVLSGPAGGVVGLAHVAQLAGEPRAIGWDMGGTSTDVSHVDARQTDGEPDPTDPHAFERVEELRVAECRIRTPALRIETVAAGGGSTLTVEHGRLVVGPDSAGAQPGPACYGFGGPLTVTDANLLLGRIQPDFFPHLFGPSRNEPLNVELVRERFVELAARVATQTGESYTPEKLALGFLRVANETMAKPIRVLSTAQGRDIRRYALVPFGGAGAQHACAIARLLGMRKVVLHPLAGVLSAWGIGCAPVQRMHVTAVDVTLDESPEAAEAYSARILEALAEGNERRARFAREEGLALAQITSRYAVQLGFCGSEQRFALPLQAVKATDAESLRERLAAAHKQRFGYIPDTNEVYVEALQQVFVGRTASPARSRASTPAAPEPATSRCGRPTTSDSTAPAVYRRICFEDGYHDAPVYRRDDLGRDEVLQGPALIVEAHSTIVLEPGFRATLEPHHRLLLLEEITDDGAEPTSQTPFKAVPSDERSRETAEVASTRPDPILLEVFHQRFMGIAEQMGAALKQTARSVNIKERLDFSCALFDAEGGLVANAPHIPVHLGAMGEAVAAIATKRRGTWRPGDAVATNDPGEGGSHLPDITVISPVFAQELLAEDFSQEPTPSEHNDAQPLFFVASRGHHADIGGTTPGSMPPFSTRLAEEGVVLRNLLLARGGRFRESQLREVLTTTEHPARSPEDNVADLQAQLAANATGQAALAQLVREFDLATVRRYMGHVQANAANAVREALRKRLDDLSTADKAGSQPGARTFADTLDDGSPIHVRITPHTRANSGQAGDTPTDTVVTLDFTGTAEELPHSNLNAPRAVTVAAVLYVMRVLLEESIPLNSGCLLPLALRIPQGSLLSPTPEAAVVGGNVETSQRIVDVLLGVFGLAAASQGTMNNLTFGTSGFQHYETICGGAGATSQGPGADAVHTHMTNTRITDPEILERRFPVRLIRFAIRRNSGGRGPGHRGGDGVIREFEFLQRMQVSLLAERRARAPFGLCAGEAGMPGTAWLLPSPTSTAPPRQLPGKFRLELDPGDRLRLETPGGGAFGGNPPVETT